MVGAAMSHPGEVSPSKKEGGGEEGPVPTPSGAARGATEQPACCSPLESGTRGCEAAWVYGEGRARPCGREAVTPRAEATPPPAAWPPSLCLAGREVTGEASPFSPGSVSVLRS